MHHGTVYCIASCEHHPMIILFLALPLQTYIDSSTGREVNDTGADAKSVNVTRMNERLAAYLSSNPSSVTVISAAGNKLSVGDDIWWGVASFIAGILLDGFTVNYASAGYHYKGACCDSSYADIHAALTILGIDLYPSFTISGSFINGLVSGAWESGRGLISIYRLARKWLFGF